MPGRRSSALLFAAAAALAGCNSKVFDHSRNRSGLEGGADRQDLEGGLDPPATCEGADDETPCDDRDICTPRSVCRAGVCFGENPFDTCTVADSVDDFSDTQGENGWWYGYWTAADDPDGSYDPETDFSLMEYCGPNTWMAPGTCSLDSMESGRRWTMNLGDGLQHPEVTPYLRLPVRRWVSDVSGPAHVHAVHRINPGTAGDGTRAMLLVDGVEIWRNEADQGTMAEKTLAIELEVGSLVEQLLHPRESQAEDMTYFSITIGP